MSLRQHVHGRIVVLLAFLTSCSAFGAAPGRILSDDYTVFVGGRTLEVIRVPTPENRLKPLERQPYSYASFEATGTVDVCVTSDLTDLSQTMILPESKGVRAFSNTMDAVAFRLTPPMTVVLEPHGRHRALVLSACLPDPSPPRESDPKVKFFGAGFHRAGRIPLCDGETLYLAPGAWVEGYVEAEGRGISVCGSGVLSGADRDWSSGRHNARGVNAAGRLATFSGEDIAVRDATFFSAWGWALVFSSVTNVLVDNVKVLGGRVINDDGVDICRGRDVVVRNSFVRSQDDSIAVKWWCENLTCTNVTLWADAANVFRIGFECEPRETGLVYRNLVFRDIDILHMAMEKTHPDEYWAHNAIYIQPAHGQTMYNIVYDSVRVYDCGPRDIFLNVKTMPITIGSKPCLTDEAGILDGLVVRNVHLPYSHGGMGINLSANDDGHPIGNVVFEDVSGHGPLTVSGKVDHRGLPSSCLGLHKGAE